MDGGGGGRYGGGDVDVGRMGTWRRRGYGWRGGCGCGEDGDVEETLVWG